MIEVPLYGTPDIGCHRYWGVHPYHSRPLAPLQIPGIIRVSFTLGGAFSVITVQEYSTARNYPSPESGVVPHVQKHLVHKKTPIPYHRALGICLM